MRNYKILLLVSGLTLLLISPLVGIRFVLADNGEGPVCPPPPSCRSPWVEYQCTANCNGEIKYRDCWETLEVVGTDASGCPRYTCRRDCGNWTPEGTTGYIWQKCSSYPNITETKPYFACAGECLETPENPRYYDNPTYSDQPDKDKGNTDLILPVKLDWDDVLSWQKEDGASSYRSRAEGSKNTYEKIVTQSELIPESCSLKSSSDYNWKVRACCNANGTNCGNWSDWHFNTSLSPELISPADPDWNGPEKAENVTIPIIFDWCDVSEAQSYYFQAYKNGEKNVYFGWPKFKKNGELESQLEFGLDLFTKITTYKWEVASCLNENTTKCGLMCGDTQSGAECGDYSNQWVFTTIDITLPPPELILPPYNPANPEEIPVVNLSNNLEWKRVEGAFSYRYEIKKGGATIINFTTTAHIINLSSINSLWDSIDNLDKIYTWKVKSCWDNEGEKCEDKWSKEWRFKTTGAPPIFEEEDSGPDDGSTVFIPTELNWDNMPGAFSYKYEVSSDSSFGVDKIIVSEVTKMSEASIEYPNLVPETPYWWRAKTCADKESKICGGWSSRSFNTFKLLPSSNLSPEENAKVFSPVMLSWKSVPGARFYQYKVSYLSKPPEETKEICPSLVGTEIISPTIILPTTIDLPLECLGEYQWSVRACLDKDCNEVGDWSNWHFAIIQPTPPAWGGIVPCGRSYDDPGTPWNERESCQFKHIFLMTKIIIDFLLWKVAPLLLVLLTIATGVIFYFSFGGPTTLAQVKSLWKAAGIGYFIIFFAWIVINFILKFLGYTEKWWIIIF